MISLLLTIIYVAFVSLGLPDSLLGSAWPVMSCNLHVPLSFAGIFSMIMTSSTVVSSLLSNKFTNKVGPGIVTSLSVLLTAIALLGISFAPSYFIICIFAVPFGLGAGGVDAALNNYVALHFKARHMSWLHCFWGIGASLSPYIMGHFLAGSLGWRGGYQAVGLIQVILSCVIFVSLPLWKKVNYCKEKSILKSLQPVSMKSAIKIKGVPFILIAFFGYCGLETTAGLWATTYLVDFKCINVETAAKFASLFYLGITLGRFIAGFITELLGDKKIIRIGIAISLIGVLLIMIPSYSKIFALVGLIILGFGCAPIYPAIIHSTPNNFGAENSQAIVGIQMASAYIGSSFMPPLFGFLSSKISLGLYPFYLFLLIIIMIIGNELLNKLKSEKL